MDGIDQHSVGFCMDSVQWCLLTAPGRIPSHLANLSQTTSWILKNIHKQITWLTPVPLTVSHRHDQLLPSCWNGFTTAKSDGWWTMVDPGPICSCC